MNMYLARSTWTIFTFPRLNVIFENSIFCPEDVEVSEIVHIFSELEYIIYNVR